MNRIETSRGRQRDETRIAAKTLEERILSHVRTFVIAVRLATGQPIDRCRVVSQARVYQAYVKGRHVLGFALRNEILDYALGSGPIPVHSE